MKNVKEMTPEITKGEVQRFSKKALYESKKYRDQKDLVEALLEDGREYSHEEADALITGYLTKEV